MGEMATAPAELVALCIDANDPMRLAQFWAVALGWEVDAAADEVELTPTDRTSFAIRFVPVEEPKSGLCRLHLDLTTSSLADQEGTVATLLGLGASHLDVGQSTDDAHVVLADPEGNELCIIEPQNNFLADCERLGSITCDGTREVGYFWSEVLGWPLVWDQDEETAVRSPAGTGPMITWGGPPLMDKPAKNRLHLHIAPPPGVSVQEQVERLIALGATHADIGQGDVDWVVMADLDGNEFCVVERG
jgi:hypothetical protein